KPGPGKQPQIFETDAATLVTPPGVLEADLAAGAMLADGKKSLLVAGTPAIKPGDRLLIVRRDWDGRSTSGTRAFATVQQVTPEKSPRGKENTRLTFTGALDLAENGDGAAHRLLRSTVTTHLYGFAGTLAVGSASTGLATLRRSVAVGAGGRAATRVAGLGG